MRTGALACLVLLAACSPDTPNANPAPPASTIPLQQALGGGADAGFHRAVTHRRFSFPADHGRHDGFRNEWWHVIGNVETGEGARYGFQVTFFRIALAPPANHNRRSRWAANHIWMAHAALTDPGANRHFAHERFAREALGLAGADARTEAPAESRRLDLWVGDWRLTAPDHAPWRLQVETDDFQLDLELEPLTPPILQGDRGLSQKSAEPGGASYYYSISRLRTHGTLRLGGAAHSVAGLSWLDREWSSNSLGPQQTGWDWFALRTQDGADLMFYRLRDRHGHTDPHSAGTLLTPGGRRIDLQAGDVVLTPKRHWRSPRGARYPVEWELQIAPAGLRWTLEAALDDQEMALSVSYWEGMVTLTENGKTIGAGYLEMTGYD